MAAQYILTIDLYFMKDAQMKYFLPSKLRKVLPQICKGDDQHIF